MRDKRNLEKPAMNGFSLNNSDFAYLQLELLGETVPATDLVSWKLMISKALTRFGGVQGVATPLDILHVISEPEKGQQCWVRVPEQSLTQVWSALSGATSTIMGSNNDVIEVSIRVVRASRYLVGVAGA